MKYQKLPIIVCFLVACGYLTSAQAQKEKILFVDSYNAGFSWSEGITDGILKGLNIKKDQSGQLDAADSRVELKIIRMDTKRNSSEAFKKKAAERVKLEIDSWQPDLVIASDDNASKYLIVPYFKNADLPIVFCGVNWDGDSSQDSGAEKYGYPFDNVTGMVEITLVDQAFEAIREYAGGERIGVLVPDNISGRKAVQYFRIKLAQNLVQEIYVATFDQWKASFLALQKQVDMLIIASPDGIAGWNDREAKAFVEANASIPSATFGFGGTPYSLVGFTRVPEELGEWSAQTALRILDGADPAEIPITTNKTAKIYLNMELASKLKIRFPIDLIERATFTSEVER